MDIKIIRYFVSQMIKEGKAEDMLSDVLRLALTENAEKAKALILKVLMKDE